MSIRCQVDRATGAKGRMGNPDDGTRDQVAAWRRMRMSWAAIARSLGRSEPDVRKAFDPEWQG